MTPTSVHDIRNLSLLGQSGSGKTTLLEKLLATAGTIGAAGSVDKGDTVSDFDPQGLLQVRLTNRLTCRAYLSPLAINLILIFSPDSWK